MIYIYCLYKDSQCYVGQTTNVQQRLYNHKSVNKLGGDFEYEILDSYEDISRKDTSYIEGEWIEIFKNIDGLECVNIQTNKKTNETWRLENMDKFRAIQKRSYDKLGIKRNNRTRMYCACGGVYVQRNLKLHLSTQKHKNFLNNS